VRHNEDGELELSEAEKEQAKARVIRDIEEGRFIFVDTRKGCVDEMVREHLERKAEGSHMRELDWIYAGGYPN
jgi:hypothetical protein